MRQVAPSDKASTHLQNGTRSKMRVAGSDESKQTPMAGMSAVAHDEPLIFEPQCDFVVMEPHGPTSKHS